MYRVKVFFIRFIKIIFLKKKGYVNFHTKNFKMHCMNYVDLEFL